jgi:sortase A
VKRGSITRLIVVVVLAAGFWQLTQAGWIPAKAAVAQVLLEHAWQQTQQDGGKIRPWPWADTWPVAKLTAPDLGIDRIVLAGDSGAVLAFGPGLSFAGAKPGEPGTVMISGHRDTHFRFLRQLAPGDRIILQTRAADVEYVVRSTQVADSNNYQPLSDVPNSLLLVTCYPFDAVQAGGPLRYLVHADAATKSHNRF